MRLSIVGTFAPLAAVLMLACSSSDSSSPPASDLPNEAGAPVAGDGAATLQDIVATAEAAGTFKTLVAAVQAAGLVSTLQSPGPFTVFAPTDTAFAKLPSPLVTELTSAPYKTELALLLKYHVLSGATKAASLLGKTASVTSVEGAALSIDGTSGKVVINGTSTVTTADVAASNGVVHIIDTVLLPTIVDTATGYNDGTNTFTSLAGAVTSAGLGATLSGAGTFTVFAPTDAAFAALKTELGDTAYNAIVNDKTKLTKLLTFHVLPTEVFAADVKAGNVTTVEGSTLGVAVSGGKVSLADSTTTAAHVVLTDLPNRNGVIHVIDKVLVPADL